MRLAEFILRQIEPILADWEKFARSLSPGSSMTRSSLRDNAEAILRATARDMQNRQSPTQQTTMSKGQGGDGGVAADRLDDASEVHGVERAGSGFHITEVVAEYRSVRASVLRMWQESRVKPHVYDIDDFNDLTHFHESLEQSITRAIESYSKRVNDSRKMFLAILSHDLRGPLHSIRMLTDLVAKKQVGVDDDVVLSTLQSSSQTMTELISDLIDFASSSLGRRMPLKRGPVNLVELCNEVLDGYRVSHPERTIHLHFEGEVNGVWDAGRLRQVICNLLSNALQHGSPEKPIELSVSLEGSVPEEATVVLVFHNEGEPIPPDVLRNIFDPLMRHAAKQSTEHHTPGGMGLGLYIVREIVLAKGGTVEVTSTEQYGTTFTVRIPRQLAS